MVACAALACLGALGCPPAMRLVSAEAAPGLVGTAGAVDLRSPLASLAAPPGTFFGTTPTRVLDSRDGTGGFSTPWGAGQGREVVVRGGSTPVPNPATAVVLNVTVTEPSASSFVTVWPAGRPRPLASNLNVAGGQTVANLVVVAVGAGGKVAIYNNQGTVHVIADVVGYFAPGSGGRLTGVTPKRLLDSRDGTGGFSTPWGPGQTRTLTVRGGATSVPADATAVVLNVTATQPSASSYLTVWPSGGLRPLASNLNVTAGRTAPNLVTVAVGASGQVAIYNNHGTVHVIADVVGYYAPSTGGVLTGVTPTRVLDSRDGTGGFSTPWGAGQVRELVVRGGSAPVPEWATAVVLNVTVTQPSASSFVTVWPAGQARPLASNLNVVGGQTVANLVVVAVGAGGKVALYNNQGSAHLIADVVAYHRQPGAPLEGVSAIAAGGSTCALLATGGLRCWGANGFGQLGDGTTVDAPGAVPVAGAGDSGSLAVGLHHACAVRGDGQVACWGSNQFGQLGDEDYGEASVAPVPVPGLSGAVRVAAGHWHTCALVAGGEVWCWGANHMGQLGDGTPDQPSGPVAVVGLGGATAVAAGAAHSCAVASGEVWCWGGNYTGQLGDGTFEDAAAPVRVEGISDAVDVSLGADSSCALLATGEVRCWGANNVGQLGDGTREASTLPTTVVGVSGATAIDSGPSHTCALVGGGELRCWGRNDQGQLGDGTTATSLVAVAVPGIVGATGVAVGSSRTCALVGGWVGCWGAPLLGDGTTQGSTAPVVVEQAAP